MSDCWKPDIENGGTCPECTKDIPNVIRGIPEGVAVKIVTSAHPGQQSSANPKTLTGALKVPVLSVVPSASIIGEAEAMRYGAFEAPRVDGSKGYGPFNWRDQNIEAMTYIDAAIRHLMSWTDGEELAPDSLVHHLKHAKASLGILIDAMEHGTWIDNRPRVRKNVASTMLEKGKRK